jgi:lysophospholipase L1-like esterase
MHQPNSQKASFRRTLRHHGRLLRLRSKRMGRATLGVLGLLAAACGSDRIEPPVLGLSKQGHHAQGLRTKANDVSHLIIVGDSISEGLGAQSQPMSYAALLYRNNDTMYPRERGHDLVHHFGPDLRYINVAHAGDTSNDVIRFQLQRLSDKMMAEAERGAGVQLQDNTWSVPGRVIVVMTVGGNDVQQAMRPNTNFTGPVLTHSMINLRAILDFFEDKRHFPGGVSMYFGNIYDVTDGEDQFHACMPGMAFPGMSDALEVWSSSYAELAAQRNATLVDLLSLFRGHGFNFANPDNPYFNARDTSLWVYDRDCIHPNNRGHHKLRRAFLEHIEQDYP